MRRIFVIGAGGVGSWLIPQLAMLKCGDITVVDADILEEKNLIRQLYDKKDIGDSKARAIAKRYGLSWSTEWYTPGSIQHEETDVIFGCVDNHVGRRTILESVDTAGCHAFIMGNGSTPADAYYYKREWKGSPLDPRVRYPHILSAHDGPLQAAGCTGDAQDETPQLVIGNSTAATLGLQLFWLWIMDFDEKYSEADVLPHLPYEYRFTETASETRKIKDAH